MARLIAFIALVLLFIFSAGCLDEGRMASQESIKQLAQRQIETVGKIVEVSRATPVPAEIAPLVGDLEEDAYSITKWTRLTQADFGRANPDDVGLDDDSQARLRALYERETKIRNAAKAAAARAGLPVTPGGEGGGSILDLLTPGNSAKGAGVAITALSILMKFRSDKKRKKTESELDEAKKRRDRAKRAAREAIQVIGQSEDTKIRKTAALKKHLLEEFAEAKQEDYAERIRAIDNGSIAPPQAGVPTLAIPDPTT